jgi:hypothetical protein
MTLLPQFSKGGQSPVFWPDILFNIEIGPNRPANQHEGPDIMKKPQRAFVVEFKSGSRKQSAKPTSIWGNVDLRAISLEVETDVPSQALQGTSQSAQTRRRVLTSPIMQSETALPPQEKRMAEETTPVADAEGSSIDTPTPIAEPKKRRGRQAKTVAPALATGEAKPSVSGDAKATKAKVSKQPRAAKSTAEADAAVVAKQPRKTRAPKQETVAVNATPADEMTDLLQLEEENQKLRKLLADKLRAENADLRKRLGHL